ncbi:NAD(P)-binding protein [Saitoella complicata NRRL Y-17804]|nr:NAD(P)-binding protein [Saitoella complicata NRRL Y-17804]ODQ54105.1 NAD(P)-binding protein [Saitoella complicata NRRL Y-17804]
MVQNKSVNFVEVPTGYPVKDKTMKLVTGEIDLEQKLEDGAVIVKVLYVSIDPYQRGRMRDASIKSYAPAFKLNAPIDNGGVARVVKTANSSYKEGDVVYGYFQWSEYQVISPQEAKALRVVENKEGLPLSHYVGALGMPGMTSWYGLTLGKQEKGKTAFISAASGAVGQIVGQLCKRRGMYVVGSAGEDAKVDFLLNECQFDAAFNYKKEGPRDALKKYCPNGIDLYWENVGGETLDAVFEAANDFSTIIACGMISQYNTTEPYGVKNIMNIVAKRIKMQGFIVLDEFDGQWVQDFFAAVPGWIKNGEMKVKEDIAEGLENAQDAFIGMLQGKNFGKAMIKVAQE